MFYWTEGITGKFHWLFKFKGYHYGISDSLRIIRVEDVGDGYPVQPESLKFRFKKKRKVKFNRVPRRARQ